MNRVAVYQSHWLALTVDSPSDELKPALVEGLIDLGGTAVQEDGQRLLTFVPPPAAAGLDNDLTPDEVAARMAEDAARRLAARAGLGSIAVHWRWQPDEDWTTLWKAGLGPRRVGDHLVVSPTWTLDRVDAGPADVLIAIDPQTAFGTGEHASTRGVLRLLEQAVPAGARVLDVGTGSGILAIAAARLDARAVDAVESDPDAIPIARDNVARNEAHCVRVERGVVDAPFLEACAGRYDLIVANVQRSVLEPLMPAFRRGLRTGGRLITGGILAVEADAMRAAAASAGFEILREDVEEVWWSALFTTVDTAPSSAHQSR